MMHRRRLHPVFLLAFVGACSADIPSAPVGVASVKGGIKHVATNRGIPNSQKYRDRGIHPATGRSGSAALEARALLDRNGNTVIEASTGSLELGTSEGSIAKTQVKLVGTAGATNFNGLHNDGYWSTTQVGLTRGQLVKVQASVTGIDGSRTDIVTVEPVVALLPDLAVPSVSAPATLAPHSPATITAEVVELNRDVGARSDCVLTVNGVEAGRSVGIWVDAGDVVSCRFMHVFDAPGTYDVRVTAANVAPGDWDIANNSASRSITIEDPGVPFEHGGLEAWEYNYDYTLYATQSGPYYFWNEAWIESSQRYTGVNGWGTTLDYVSVPYQRVDGTVLLDGTVVQTASLGVNWTYSYEDPPEKLGARFRFFCAGYDDPTGTWAQMCSRDYGDGRVYTDWNYSINRGTVTYHSLQHNCSPYCSYYEYNEVRTWGNGLTLGLTETSTIAMKVDFVAADGTARVLDATVSSFWRESRDRVSNQCWQAYDEYHCQNFVSLGYFMYGIVEF